MNKDSQPPSVPALASASGSPSSNLKSLLKRIACLPWKWKEGVGKTAVVSSDENLVCQFWGTIDDESLANVKYQVHAANVLPELVTAFDGLNLKCLMRIPESTVPPCEKCPTCIARAALLKAKMENDQSSNVA